MPVFRAEGTEQSYLATQLAETAMGYQILTGEFLSFLGDNYLVIGSEIVIPFTDFSKLARELNRLSEFSWEALLDSSQRVRFDQVPVLVAQQSHTRLAASLLDVTITRVGAAAKFFVRQEIVATVAHPDPRLFFRFSANPRDPRVLHDGQWTPGTYGTTYSDLRLVPSGFAAVGRYALPIPKSARYVYSLMTDSAPRKVGTVAPNFGQAGSGEVLFPVGAHPVFGVPHVIEHE